MNHRILGPASVIACVCLLGFPALPARSEVPDAAGEAVEVGNHVLLIQGFEGDDVLSRKPNVSYLSGVPEEAEVEVWDNPLYNRRKATERDSGVACRITTARKSQGNAALEARFSRDDRVLRVSLRNNIGQPGADRPACNSLGCFDVLKGDIFNPAKTPVAAKMRMLGGFAVTDKASTFSLLRNLTLKPGWNSFAVTSAEASATFVDPHDATCVEFRVPGAGKTVLCFDNFRMERQSLGANLAKFAKCFDFGVAYFNWPGFTYGSVKWDEGLGYGFTKGDQLTHGGDLHVINDELTRDGFVAPASFRVKLPNGRYKVVTQTGNYWAQRDGGLNIEIRAEGKRAYFRPRMSPEEFIRFKYAHENADHWKRDVDLWGTYDEGSYFRTISFEAEVADGALDLDFLLPAVADGGPHGQSVWTYLIVYPADKEALIAPELKWLNEKVRTIYNTVSHANISREFALYNREEVICPEEFLWPELAEARRQALKPTPQELARGYVHFLRHQHDLVTPDSVPLPNETGDELALFAARGQTVQWTTALYPLADLKAVGVSLGDFKEESGRAVLRADKAELRLVSYRPMTPVTSNHAECFHYIGPGVLIPAAAIDVPKAFPRQWWFSLPVPQDAPAGLYRAQATFTVGGKPSSTIEIALRVLPFALEEPKGVSFAIDYRGTMSFRPEDGPAELAFFRSLGMNTVWYQGGADGLAEMQRNAEKAGLGVEVGHPDKYKNWRWPREYRYALYRRYLADPGVSFQPRHTGHREGRKIRFTHGFWLWRSGIRHRVVQTQPNAAERVYYAHYGHAKFGPCSYLFPSLRGPGQFNPAPTLYEVRDGITDWRYIQTLEDLTKAAVSQGRNGPALDEARAYLAKLAGSLDPNLDRYYFERRRNFNHVGRFGLHDTVWTGRRYEMERWDIARHIAALVGNAAGELPPAPLPKAPANLTGGGSVIAYKEYFGPFWVDESQFMYISQKEEGVPRLQAEVPKTPAGLNWATVLVKLDQPSELSWTVVLKGPSGRQVAAESVGPLKRWKSRWVLRTAHLAPGRYTLEIVLSPAGRDIAQTAEMKTEITVLPHWGAPAPPE